MCGWFGLVVFHGWWVDGFCDEIPSPFPGRPTVPVASIPWVGLDWVVTIVRGNYPLPSAASRTGAGSGSFSTSWWLIGWVGERMGGWLDECMHS